MLLPGELANGRIRMDAQLYSIRSWQVPRLGRIGKRSAGQALQARGSRHCTRGAALHGHSSPCPCVRRCGDLVAPRMEGRWGKARGVCEDPEARRPACQYDLAPSVKGSGRLFSCEQQAPAEGRGLAVLTCGIRQGPGLGLCDDGAQRAIILSQPGCTRPARPAGRDTARCQCVFRCVSETPRHAGCAGSRWFSRRCRDPTVAHATR